MLSFALRCVADKKWIFSLELVDGWSCVIKRDGVAGWNRWTGEEEVRLGWTFSNETVIKRTTSLNASPPQCRSEFQIGY